MGTVLNISSVVDPDPESDPDPVGSETVCRIRIRIRNKSFRIRIRAALIRNEIETKLLIKFTISQPDYVYVFLYDTILIE